MANRIKSKIEEDENQSSQNRIFREQLITLQDLELFKQEMISEMKKLLWQNGVHPMKKWLKTPEVRKLLNISYGTLQNLRVNGSLPFTRIGGIIYYDYEDIQKMLLSHKNSTKEFVCK
jgi:hypothetical protein